MTSYSLRNQFTSNKLPQLPKASNITIKSIYLDKNNTINSHKTNNQRNKSSRNIVKLTNLNKLNPRVTKIYNDQIFPKYKNQTKLQNYTLQINSVKNNSNNVNSINKTTSNEVNSFRNPNNTLTKSSMKNTNKFIINSSTSCNSGNTVLQIYPTDNNYSSNSTNFEDNKFFRCSKRKDIRQLTYYPSFNLNKNSNLTISYLENLNINKKINKKKLLSNLTKISEFSNDRKNNNSSNNEVKSISQMNNTSIFDEKKYPLTDRMMNRDSKDRLIFDHNQEEKKIIKESLHNIENNKNDITADDPKESDKQVNSFKLSNGSNQENIENKDNIKEKNNDRDKYNYEIDLNSSKSKLDLNFKIKHSSSSLSSIYSNGGNKEERKNTVIKNNENVNDVNINKLIDIDNENSDNDLLDYLTLEMNNKMNSSNDNKLQKKINESENNFLTKINNYFSNKIKAKKSNDNIDNISACSFNNYFPEKKETSIFQSKEMKKIYQDYVHSIKKDQVTYVPKLFIYKMIPSLFIQSLIDSYENDEFIVFNDHYLKNNIIEKFFSINLLYEISLNHLEMNWNSNSNQYKRIINKRQSSKKSKNFDLIECSKIVENARLTSNTSLNRKNHPNNTIRSNLSKSRKSSDLRKSSKKLTVKSLEEFIKKSSKLNSQYYMNKFILPSTNKYICKGVIIKEKNYLIRKVISQKDYNIQIIKRRLLYEKNDSIMLNFSDIDDSFDDIEDYKYKSNCKSYIYNDCKKLDTKYYLKLIKNNQRKELNRSPYISYVKKNKPISKMKTNVCVLSRKMNPNKLNNENHLCSLDKKIDKESIIKKVSTSKYVPLNSSPLRGENRFSKIKMKNLNFEKFYNNNKTYECVFRKNSKIKCINKIHFSVKSKEKNTKKKNIADEKLFEMIRKRDFQNFERYFTLRDVDLELKNAQGNTLLNYAVICQDYNFIEFLVKKGAKVNTYNAFFNTPLHNALIKNDFKTADLLIKNKANEGFLNIFNKTPWQYIDTIYHNS